MRRFLGLTALSSIETLSLTSFAAAEGEPAFRCKPSENCVMNVMVSGGE